MYYMGIFLLVLTRFNRISNGKYILVTDSDSYDWVNLERNGVSVNFSHHPLGLSDVQGGFQMNFYDAGVLFVDLRNRAAYDVMKRFAHDSDLLIDDITTHRYSRVDFTRHIDFVYITANHTVEPAIITYSACKLNIVLLAYNSCSSSESQLLTNYFHSIAAVTSCFVINDDWTSTGDVPLILDLIEVSKITYVALMVPWKILPNILELMREDRFNGATVITNSMGVYRSRLLTDTFTHLDIMHVFLHDGLVYRDMMPFFATRRFANASIEIKRMDALLKKFSHHTHHQSITTNRSLEVPFHPLTKRKRKPLRVATIIYSPFVLKVIPDFTLNGECLNGVTCYDEITQVKTCCSGMAVEMFDIIAKDLDFCYEMYITKNGTWGSLVEEVVSRRADVGVQEIFSTPERREKVDFTYRLTPNNSPKVIIIREVKPDYVIVNFTFLEAMEPRLIVYVPLITIAVVAIVFLLENIGFRLRYNKSYNIRESISYVNGLLYKRNLGGVNPRRWPARVVSITFAISMTVLISSYTAQLTASNIESKENNVFQGFADQRFQDPSFKVGLMELTWADAFFRSQSNKSVISMRNIKKFNAKKIVVKDDKEGVAKVFSKEIDAYIGTSGYIEDIIDGNESYCSKLMMYVDKQFMDEFQFILQKGDTLLRKKLSESILRLTENGKLQYIISKWKNSRTCSDYKNEGNQVPWEYFGGLLVIISGTLVLCIFLLVAENLYESKRADIKAKRQATAISEPYVIELREQLDKKVEQTLYRSETETESL